ncbi:MAG TPA: LD-carboxypeptidase [Bacteroidota bacterium]
MVLKPPRLRTGDLIGLVSPASAPSSAEMVERGVRYLEHLGYGVKVGNHAADVHGYLAGTDDQRAADFNEMIRDKTVRAIFAIRGGYGTPRLLRLIDYQGLKRSPKIIVGYSDITALQLAIFQKTRLVTFSGPMAGVEMAENIDHFTEEHFWRLVTSKSRIGKMLNPPEEPLRILRAGKGNGKMLGGNMATALSLLRTPYAPDLKGSILVVEDVDEAPHRVDRMFTQLRNAGVLETIAGLVFGKFTDCVPSDPSKPYLTIDQVLESVAQRCACPVIANFQYGHVPRKLTIPFGLRTRLDGTKGFVEVLESAVS